MPRPLDAPLTERQREVLRLYLAGASLAETGRRLQINKITVRQHLQYALRKAALWVTRTGKARKRLSKKEMVALFAKKV